ncbi:MAG: carboxypeptidase-like regulatory domain-containing protein [Bacteroidales bacterium]|nr:carboxypeptidase-like regulatory domain-containing protein [Bacteroidales bacterium]
MSILFKVRFFRFLMVFSILALNFFNSYSQTTKIIGQVVDDLTNEPIPFANVFLKNTTVGATTGFDGKFSIVTQVKSDSLIVSTIGYHRQAFRVKLYSFQEIHVRLKTSDVMLQEVVILPGENPAHAILHKVWARKDSNNLKKMDFYQVEIYNKIQFDINNITDEFKERRVFKPFEFIFENVDTSALNGKVYLPLLLTESISDFYYQNNPELKKEVIKASRISGVNNESISKFLGNMYQQVNIYDDFISLFDKNFVSPIADFGLRYYRYYLIDSAFIDNNWSYKIMFKPRRKKELTFTGEIWIADTTFAVKRVDMKIVDNLNINYINAMEISQDFQLQDDKYWLLELDRFLVDFNVVDNNKTLTGFYAHKTTSYQNYIFEKPHEAKTLKEATQVDVQDLAFYRDENYWDSVRHFELNKEEKIIYNMVDTITNLPVFRTYYDVIAMITTGYYNTDKFDFGPYYQSISFNAVEGLRLRIGGRTSNIWNEKVRLYGHVAYGVIDEKFKYGAGFIWLHNRNPRRGFGAEYKLDMEQLGESVNALRQDNIVASLFRRRPFTKLTMVEQYNAYYEHEWVQGFSNKLNFRRRNIFPLQDEVFVINENGNSTNFDNLVNSEFEFNLRFAYKETYLVDKFNRTNLGTKYPVFNIWIAYGVPELFSADFEYWKLKTSVQHWFNVRSFGWSQYILDAGLVFGTLPYAMLEIHPGNETYSFDKYAFNKMNYYEFISDRYVSLFYTHHFDGFFLNRIPLMRELEWREVVYFRGVIGDLSSKNQQFSQFPVNSGWLSQPYYEAGVAVENIFKVLRVDAGWRLSYLNNPDISKFSLMATLYLSF